ncbi:hypothetical protein ABZ135_36855 [Streptomyces sp. NPDC006339]|uniref:hypothetical protein n=1 Tax=Streptomyces sp. NPDC006339 TaxID=3156755 RepID=UPI0033BF0F1F
MDDYELTDGSSTRPLPPTAYEERRRATREAVAAVWETWDIEAAPPTEAEARVARELAQDVRASMHEPPAIPGDHRPPLLRRLQQLVGLGQLVRALVDSTPPGQIRPELQDVLGAAEVMCAAFEEPLADLEDYLVRYSADHPDRLPELEQQRHSPITPVSIWMDTYSALSCMGTVLRQVLVPIAQAAR